MKKFICIFTAAILALCFSVGIYADDEAAADIFLPVDEAESISQNMSEDDLKYYGFLFGTWDVNFDFEHSFRYYYTSFKKDDILTSFKDIMMQSNIYVPALSGSGEFIGYASIKKTSESWEISSVSASDYYKEFYSLLSANSITDYYSGEEYSYNVVGNSGFDDLGIFISQDSSGEGLYFDYGRYFDDMNSGIAKASLTAYITSEADRLEALSEEAKSWKVTTGNPTQGSESSVDWWLTNQDDLPNVDMDDPSMPESIGEVIEIPEPEPVIDPELQAENERFFAEMAASGNFPTQGGENPDTGIFPTVTLLAVTAALAVWAKRDRG